MRKPANTAGVVFALVMATSLLVGTFALGPSDTTRRGTPVWLLGAIGVPCFLWIAVQCWLRPRRQPGVDRRRSG